MMNTGIKRAGSTYEAGSKVFVAIGLNQVVEDTIVDVVTQAIPGGEVMLMLQEHGVVSPQMVAKSESTAKQIAAYYTAANKAVTEKPIDPYADVDPELLQAVKETFFPTDPDAKIVRDARIETERQAILDDIESKEGNDAFTKAVFLVSVAYSVFLAGGPQGLAETIERNDYELTAFGYDEDAYWANIHDLFGYGQTNDGSQRTSIMFANEWHGGRLRRVLGDVTLNFDDVDSGEVARRLAAKYHTFIGQPEDTEVFIKVAHEPTLWHDPYASHYKQVRNSEPVAKLHRGADGQLVVEGAEFA
jgi:hypothetical protein